MKRKLGLTLSIIFLSVQLFALLHMAEHGFIKHEHKGHTCSVYLSTEQSKYSTTENPISLPSRNLVECSFTFPVQTPPCCTISPTPSTRAPPFFLLS